VSNLEANPQEALCAAKAADGPVSELLYAREVVIGTRDGTPVYRTLPNKERRMIGAWCFVDHYGPTDITGKPGMSVAPHPHCGLQTVSWLLAGEVLHRDSLGNEQLIMPGQLNLMTAGQGISHAEQSPRQRSAILHGVQLWVALPGPDRAVGAHFEHHADLPEGRVGGLSVTVLMGQLAGLVSPAKAYTPIVGAQLSARAGTAATVPLNPGFEHGLLDLDDGKVLEYLGMGRDRLELSAEKDSRWLLLGGAPFEEEIVMWWNFVGRSHPDIVRMREDWMAGDRFGVVTGFDGAPLPAPPMPATTLVPRGRKR
jgi:redox-sensitive bicupin YhaK (pirin superfamily)